jgi:DNA-binding transcriptional LysR family regulator
MMNLERLRTLHAVATHGSLHAAAEVLNVSASAISQQIAKLEREVGEPLLERRGRGVALTDAANLLAGHAERALSVLRQAEAELDGRRAVVSGELRIAAFATAARGLAPAALRHLGENYARLRVGLQEIESLDSLPLLLRGDLDLVLAQDWSGAPIPLPDGLERRALMDDVADIALPRGHRLAGKDRLTLRDLVAEPWISWPAGSNCHDWLVLTLRGLGHDPDIRHTAVEYATQLALVGAGLGAAVLPRLGRAPVPDDVQVVEVTPALTRHVYAVWRRDATRRTAIVAALDAFAVAVAGLPRVESRATRRAASERAAARKTRRAS